MCHHEECQESTQTNHLEEKHQTLIQFTISNLETWKKTTDFHSNENFTLMGIIYDHTVVVWHQL